MDANLLKMDATQMIFLMNFVIQDIKVVDMMVKPLDIVLMIHLPIKQL